MAFVEKIKTIGAVVKNPMKCRNNSSYSRNDMKTLCNNQSSPVASILKDRTMFKHIRDGNASDKGLKRDALSIQQTFDRDRKAKQKAERYQKVIDKRGAYKRRYKCDPL